MHTDHVSRRQEILQVAAMLFVQHGYKSTTVRAIADSAGILSGSLYHHFQSKEVIAYELIQDYLSQLLASYQRVIDAHESPAEQLQHLVRAAITLVPKHRAALIVLQQEGAVLGQQPRFAIIQKVSTRAEKIWSSVIKEGIGRGQFNPTVDPAVPFYIIRDAVVSAARWFDPKGRITIEAFSEQYATIFMNGVMRPPKAND